MKTDIITSAEERLIKACTKFVLCECDETWEAQVYERTMKKTPKNRKVGKTTKLFEKRRVWKEQYRHMEY